MKITRKKVNKFQEGGVIEDPNQADLEAAPEAPEEQGGGEDPLMQLAQMAAQALQTQDAQLAFQVCQAFLQLIQQQAGGQEAPEEGEPVYRKGGKLAYRI